MDATFKSESVKWTSHQSMPMAALAMRETTRRDTHYKKVKEIVLIQAVIRFALLLDHQDYHLSINNENNQNIKNINIFIHFFILYLSFFLL